MSVINRIEFSNFLNLDNHRPSESEWRPHWRHVVLNLRGLSTAIVATNGLGKSTGNRAVFALLSRDRRFVGETRDRAAPKRRGLWSHIRLEVLYQDASIVRSPGLIGFGVPGEPYVFGLYGYSDTELLFYVYRGHLEDCPVALVSGHHKEMVPNADFETTLKGRPGLIWNPSVADWRKAVYDHFDRSLIHQMLAYQKAGGGDGAEHFFKVHRRDGEDYDTAFFFAHIAPELLVNVMDVYGKEGEYRFEDTLLESARPVITAERLAGEKKEELKVAEGVFNSLTRAKEYADDYIAKREDLGRIASQSLAEARFITEIVEGSPIAGIPRPTRDTSPQTAHIADRMVCLDGQWLFPDWLLAELLGTEAYSINQDALAKGIRGVTLKGSQLIENPTYIKNAEARDRRGKPNQGYPREAAISLLQRRERFAQGWDPHTAQRAINYAYSWYEEKGGDPNPLRQEQRALARDQSALGDAIQQNRGELGDCEVELRNLEDRLESLAAAEHALSRMRLSGLFSASELADPAQTSNFVAGELERARKATQGHELRKVELNAFREAFRAVEKEFPGALPQATLDRLEADAIESDSRADIGAGMLNDAREALRQAEQQASVTSAALEETRLANTALTALHPKARQFQILFPNESPVGLKDRVRSEYQQALQRRSALEVRIEQLNAEYSILEPLASNAQEYWAIFGTNDPNTQVEAVVRDLNQCDAELKEAMREKGEADSLCSKLGLGAAALVSTRLRFGHEVDVSNLERLLEEQETATLLEQQSAERDIVECALLVDALSRFESRYGPGTSPEREIASRAERLPLALREHDELHSKLDELRAQELELQSVGVTPGPIARRVLSLLGANVASVHSVISGLSLTPGRRAELLTHFSHVLHGPVFDDLEEARAALVALEREGIEFPVFMRAGLEEFCASALLRQSGDVAYTFLVGARTLPVRALIDPRKIATLLEDVRTKIVSLEPRAKALGEECIELDPNSASGQLLALAQQAVRTNAQIRVVRAEEALSSCDTRLAELSEQRSPESLAEIRGACEFINRGGEATLADAKENARRWGAALSELTLRRPEYEYRASEYCLSIIRKMSEYQTRGGCDRMGIVIHERESQKAAFENLEQEVPRLAARERHVPFIDAAEEFESLGGWDRLAGIASELDSVQRAYDLVKAAAEESKSRAEAAESEHERLRGARNAARERMLVWRDKLLSAQDYLDAGGLDFDSTFDDRMAAYRHAEKLADARTRFDFTLAQQAVDMERDDKSGRAALLARKDERRARRDTLVETLKRDESRFASQRDELDELRRGAESLDRSVVAILQQWREVRELMAVLPPGIVPSKTEESIFLQGARAQMEDIGSAGHAALPNLIDDLASNISNFPLANHRAAIQESIRGMKSAVDQLRRAVQGVLKAHDGQLSSTECNELSTGQEDAVLVDKVRVLHRYFEEYVINAERVHSKSQEDVESAKARMLASLAGFTEGLNANFKTLKSTLARVSSGAATLRVEGELIEEASLKDQIEKMVAVVRTEENRRAEDERTQRRVDSPAVFDEKVKGMIRESFYRAVIKAPGDTTASGPIIYFQHSAIAGGRAVRLTEALSTGQANALALLILTKLADFTMARDLQADGGIAGRRRRPSSTRVVIIDGLFSNLSDKRLIRESLSVIRGLKGTFQLVGWIHNALYENDPELFPSYVALRRVGGEHGFVLVGDGDDDGGLPPEDGELAALEFHADKMGNAAA